jgi:hypothetical protein
MLSRTGSYDLKKPISGDRSSLPKDFFVALSNHVADIVHTGFYALQVRSLGRWTWVMRYLSTNKGKEQLAGLIVEFSFPAEQHRCNRNFKVLTNFEPIPGVMV